MREVWRLTTSSLAKPSGNAAASAPKTVSAARRRLRHYEAMQTDRLLAARGSPPGPW